MGHLETMKGIAKTLRPAEIKKNIDASAQWAVDTIPGADKLKPDWLTIAAAGCGLLAAHNIVQEEDGKALTFLAAAGIFDAYDGAFARAKRTKIVDGKEVAYDLVTAHGEAMDSVFDRYVDDALWTALKVRAERRGDMKVGQMIDHARDMGMKVPFARAVAETQKIKVNKFGLGSREQRFIDILLSEVTNTVLEKHATIPQILLAGKTTVTGALTLQDRVNTMLPMTNIQGGTSVYDKSVDDGRFKKTIEPFFEADVKERILAFAELHDATRFLATKSTYLRLKADIVTGDESKPEYSSVMVPAALGLLRKVLPVGNMLYIPELSLGYAVAKDALVQIERIREFEKKQKEEALTG